MTDPWHWAGVNPPTPPKETPVKNEPLITVASLTAIVGALLLLLREFGVPITEGQHDAIVGFALVIAPLAVAAVARGKVTPVNKP